MVLGWKACGDITHIYRYMALCDATRILQPFQEDLRAARLGTGSVAVQGHAAYLNVCAKATTPRESSCCEFRLHCKFLLPTLDADGLY